MAHYGLKIDPAYVLDKKAYKHQLPQAQGGGEQTIYFAPMLKEDTINNGPAFMQNIKGLVAMQISPVVTIPENIDETKVKATRLLASSDQAWLMEGMINLNPMFITPPASPDELGTHDLAYILEGKFTSYFAGKEIPKKEKGEKEVGPEGEQPPIAATDTAKAFTGLKTENRIVESSAPAKLFVLGCTQMLHDNMLDPEGRSTNATFLLNVIDHMNGEDAIAVMRGKQQTLNPLAVTSALTKGIIKGFNIAVLPILVVLFGLGVLFRRNLRKKKIAEMYN